MTNTYYNPRQLNGDPARVKQFTKSYTGESLAALEASHRELLACLKDFLDCGPNAGHNQQLLINCRAAVERAEQVQP